LQSRGSVEGEGQQDDDGDERLQQARGRHGVGVEEKFSGRVPAKRNTRK
jgi:hypothetical protein